MILCIIGTIQAENVLGVSESDMISYHSVFADSGNSGAQVSGHNNYKDR